jgi:hypothetical protein
LGLGPMSALTFFNMVEDMIMTKTSAMYPIWNDCLYVSLRILLMAYAIRWRSWRSHQYGKKLSERELVFLILRSHSSQVVACILEGGDCPLFVNGLIGVRHADGRWELSTPDW